MAKSICDICGNSPAYPSARINGCLAMLCTAHNEALRRHAIANGWEIATPSTPAKVAKPAAKRKPARRRKASNTGCYAMFALMFAIVTLALLRII